MAHRVLGPRLADHPWTPRVLLGVVVALFTVLVGDLWSLRYWAFQTAAWDLGVYNQAMYTTVSGQGLFYYTADLPAGINGHLFAAHFAPFLFVLVPLYALAPTPSGLLVLQAAGLGLGAVPVYYLARDRLGAGPWPTLFVALYLLTPLTIGSGWYDFHPEAFLPVTTLSAIYFYERQRIAPFLGFWLLALAVIETLAPFLLLLSGAGLGVALWRRFRHRDPGGSTELRLNAAAFGMAAGWLAVSLAVMYSLSPNGGTFGPGYGGAWSTLGASSIFDVYPRALMAPLSAAAALAHDAGLKALYLALVLGAFGFMPLFGPRRYLLPVAAWLGLALLSDHFGYYVLNDQYVDYMLPFLVPGAIAGVERWRSAKVRWPRVHLSERAVSGTLVGGLVLSTAIASPFLAAPIDSFNAVPHGLPTVTPHDELLHRVLAYIPSDASVLTTSRLFPELSDRSNAFVLPASSLFVGGRTFSGVVGTYVNESRYVLVDYLVDFSGATVLLRTANLSGFGLEIGAQGAYLFERGWTGAPALWLPFTRSASATEVTPGVGAPVRGGPGGPVLLHTPADPTGRLWEWPELEGVPPGEYRAEATVSVNATVPGPQASFAVLNATIDLTTTVAPVSGGGYDYAFTFARAPGPAFVISNQTVDWNGQGPAGTTATLNATFDWSGPGVLETEGWVVSPGVTERLYGVSIVQLSPSW